MSDEKDIINVVGNMCSWDQLELSSKALGSMPYGNFRINVYEDTNNFLPVADSKKKRYFYAPIALLDHESATCDYNRISAMGELHFRIETWNENIEEKIAEFISELTDQEVKTNRVQVIPFEKVLILSSSSSCKGYYQLSKEWKPYQQQKSVWFTATCAHNDEQELVKSMHSKPERFSNLELLFSHTSQTLPAEMSIPVNFSPKLTNQLIDLKDQKNVVNFDAYRTSSFDTINAIVSYAGTNINIGSGMDISKGIFSAPVAGVYSFNFNGHTEGNSCSTTGTRVYLQLNGQTKTTAHTGGSLILWIPISCSVTLQLKIGDKVSIVLDEGCLYDTPDEMFTHFSGRLLYQNLSNNGT